MDLLNPVVVLILLVLISETLKLASLPPSRQTGQPTTFTKKDILRIRRSLQGINGLEEVRMRRGGRS